MRPILAALIVIVGALQVSAGASISVSPSSKTLDVGEGFQFGVIGGNGTTKWSISDPMIATVNAAGVVTGRAPGETTITAKRGSQYATAQTIVRIGSSQVYYVDPDWGGSKTGAAGTPWTTLDSGAWTTINAALASGDVTVYFSARDASSDANETTTSQIAIVRTNGSSHRLTLDGNTKYNSNDSAPSWSNNPGSRKFQITSTTPVFALSENNNVTVRGFSLVASQGQIIFWAGGHNLIIEDNEGISTVTNSEGPGIYYSYTQQEGTSCPTPTPAEDSCQVYTNITIRRNYIHDTEGEGIYIGGCADNSPCVAHDGVLIESNTIGPNIAIFGGEPDGIDIKDGLRNVIVRGNTIMLQTESRDGITLESSALIERNYIEGAGRHGIAFSAFWNNAGPSRANPIVRNNIIVNTGLSTTLGFSYRVGIQIELNGSGNEYSNPEIYNNTVYKVQPVGNAGYAIATAVPGTSVRNNIGYDTASEPFTATAGTLTAKDHNLWFKSGTTPVVVNYGGTTYTTATIASFDATSLAVNPMFVSTGTPYTATNFSLQAGSPALAVGAVLSSLFTNDYAGTTRGAAWDMGSWKVTP